MGKVVDCEISETVPAVPAGRRTQDPPVKADRPGKTYGKDTGYMKRSKRWAALFMTLCLLAGLMAVPVRAADVTDADIAKLEQELEAANQAVTEAEEAAKKVTESINVEELKNKVTEEKSKVDSAQEKLDAAIENVIIPEGTSEEDKEKLIEEATATAKQELEEAKVSHGNAVSELETANRNISNANSAVESAKQKASEADKKLKEAKALKQEQDDKKQEEAEKNKVSAPTTSEFYVSSTSLDFGNLKQNETGSSLSKTVTIKNSGNYAMDLKVTSNASGFSMSGFPGTLAVGAQSDVTISVSSTKNVGTFSDYYIVSAAFVKPDGSKTSYTDVRISCYAKVGEDKYTLSLSPTSKDFGKLVEGYEEKTAKEKELTVTVTNKSDNTVRMGDVKGNDHFTVTATQSGTISLKYNEDVTYKIVPKQGLKAGSYTDKIVFQTREGATAEFKATLVVEKKEAALTLSPSTLEFGTAQQGYTPVNYQTVTIKNNTDYPMTLEQPSSYNYEIGLLSNKSLPAGGTATFTIRPMTGLMANSYNGKITVRANGYSADLSVNFTVTANLMLLTFLDVPNGYSLAADIAYVTQRGLMNGTGNGNFTPYGPTTRGQIVTILHRLAGQPVVVGTGFTDVAAGSYCENAVKWAAAIGITKGYEDGTFKPGDPITREQMATFLFRYASTRNLTTALRADLNKFPDGDSVSAYARDALAWANGAGLVNGTGEGTLNPSGGATRAQAAAILHRFCENVAR